MTPERRPVTRGHLHARIGLTVRPDRQGLVSPDVKTLAGAPCEPGSRVWGLWTDATPVGHRACSGVARDRHCPRLTLGVSDAAHSAQGFYECLGFRRTGRVVEGERIMTREVTE